MAKKSIRTKKFDQKFDDAEDISEYLIEKRATKKVNVDFNVTFLKQLDVMANIIGVTRQSLIKMWLYERLQQEKQKNVLDVN